MLDSEKWKQADVPSEIQALITYVYKNESFPYELCHSDINQCNKTTNVILIGEEKYAIVGTVLVLVQIIHEYCRYYFSLYLLYIKQILSIINKTKQKIAELLVNYQHYQERSVDNWLKCCGITILVAVNLF